jgi:hypothetical protein
MISVLGGLSQELTRQKIKEKLEDVAEKQAEINAEKYFKNGSTCIAIYKFI